MSNRDGDDVVLDAEPVDAGRWARGFRSCGVVRAESGEVDGDATGHVLYVGLGQAAVAGLAQACAADRLGDRAFGAGALVVKRLSHADRP